MAGDTVDCFNCGHANPAWAHVCRYCGVTLQADAAISTPVGFVPTDSRSLLSLVAAVGTIFIAVLVGAILSNLNPVSPTVGVSSPSPSPSVTAAASATPEPIPTETPVPSATPVPLPGVIAFGTGLEGNQVTGATDTFAPGSTFAHTVAQPEPFGVPQVREGVYRLEEDGSETLIVDPANNPLDIDPNTMQAAFGPIATDQLRNSLGGPGRYLLRVFVGEELIAQGEFTLSE